MDTEQINVEEALSDDSKEADAAAKKSEKLVRRWLAKIEVAKDQHEDYYKMADQIVRDFRSVSVDDDGNEKPSSKYNIQWPHIATMQPALYSNIPTMATQRRGGTEDPIVRKTADVLDRALTFYITDEASGFDRVMRASVKDLLLPGRAQAWIHYSPTWGQPTIIRLDDGEAAPEGVEVLKDKEGQYYEVPKVEYEELVVKHLFYKDFLHEPAREWSDVTWVAKRTRLTEDEVEEEFGEEIAKKLKYSSSYKEEAEGDSDEDGVGENDAIKHDVSKTTEVWEVWDKREKKVAWIASCYKEAPLRYIDDPLELDGFFPCPEPLLATTTNENLIPIPDGALVKATLDELNLVTERESLLTEAVRVIGAYDAKQDKLKEAFEANDNQFVPMDDWDDFAAREGFKGAVDIFPLEEIVNALTVLGQRKQSLKADYYELTGFSDVMRGETNPQESATSQEYKVKYVGLRLSERQSSVSRFARGILNIMGGVIGSKFAPETIAAITNEKSQPGTPDYQSFMGAMALLKNKFQRRLMIDIETDSTIKINETIEKQERIEMVNAAGAFLQQTIALAQTAPAFIPAAVKLLMFALQSFRAGRPVEQYFEASIEQWQKDLEASKNQPPPPDPKMVQAQAEIQIKQMEMQSDSQVAMQKLQLENQALQGKLQLQQMELEMKQQGRANQIQADQQVALQKIQSELMIQQAKMEQEQAKMLLDFKAKMKEITSDMGVKMATAKMEAQIKAHPVGMKVADDKPAKPKKFIINRDAEGRMMDVIAHEVNDEAPDEAQMAVEEALGGNN